MDHLCKKTRFQGVKSITDRRIQQIQRFRTTTGYAKITLHFAGSHLENRLFSEISGKKSYRHFTIFYHVFYILRRKPLFGPHDFPMIACKIYSENGFFKTLLFFWNFQKVKPKVKNLFGKVKKKLKNFGRKKKLKYKQFKKKVNFPQNRTI